MKKMVNGVIVDCTQEEIFARRAEEAAWEEGRAERDWKTRIAATDSGLPRYVEDIIDAMDTGTRARLAEETLAKYQEKKQLRAEKEIA